MVNPGRWIIIGRNFFKFVLMWQRKAAELILEILGHPSRPCINNLTSQHLRWLLQRNYMERGAPLHQLGLDEGHCIIPLGSKDPRNQGFTCHEVELNVTHLFYDFPVWYSACYNNIVSVRFLKRLSYL